MSSSSRTFYPCGLPALLESARPEIGREINWLPDVLGVERGLWREEVEEVAGGFDPVVDDHGLHELVLAQEEIVGLAHGEAAALGVDLGRARLEVGPEKSYEDVQLSSR